MSKIRFAIIGYGYIGKRHAQIIREHPEAELVAVYDIDKSIECENIHHKNVSNIDLLEIDPDIVCVCTPNSEHYFPVVCSIGIAKGIVIEKPMTLRLDDAEQIVKRAQKAGTNIHCVMQNRYTPTAKWLKQIISDEILGQAYQVHLNLFWNRDDRYYTPDSWHGSYQDGGVLFTQFSHFIDIMYWLFGDIDSIQGLMLSEVKYTPPSFYDAGSVNFEFKNKATLGSINFSTLAYEKNMESSITILAENGTVKVSGQYMDKVEYCNIDDYYFEGLEESAPANQYKGYQGSANNHDYVIQNAIDVLKERDEIHCTGMEGYKVVDIINRIYASAK